MIPIKQTALHTETTKGNCLQAALASILEMSIEEVPRFDGESWYVRLMDWLERYKIELVRWDYEVCFKGYYLVAGKSPRGEFKHIVVYENGLMAHDPHPDGTGLKEIESTWLLVSYNPAWAVKLKGGRTTPEQEKLMEKHGTPTEFEWAVWKAHNDLFVTLSEAEKAIEKYKMAWEKAKKE